MNQTIKAIIFDFGGVIGKPQNQRLADTMSAKLGLNKEDFAAVYGKYRRDYDIGLVDGASYWKNIFSHLNLEPDTNAIAELIKLDIASWTEKNTEIISLISELKQKDLQLLLLSNMPADFLDFLNKGFECLTHFDHCFFSSKIKMVKPDAGIYEHLLTKSGLKPDECVFIDDSPHNVAAAIQCGIQTIHFKNAEQLKNELYQVLNI